MFYTIIMSCTKFEYDVNEIIPNLWLGNVKSAYDQSFHNKYNIKYIISVFDELIRRVSEYLKIIQ